MKAKYLMTALLAATMAAPALYAAEECNTEKPPVERKEMKRRPPMRGPRNFQRPSREVMEAVKAYKENPTAENKAKVKTLLEKEYDARLKKEEQRISEMKTKKAENIEKRLERILKAGERPTGKNNSDLRSGVPGESAVLFPNRKSCPGRKKAHRSKIRLSPSHPVSAGSHLRRASDDFFIHGKNTKIHRVQKADSR